MVSPTLGLTLTWDVLKCIKERTDRHCCFKINFNMGCIEIVTKKQCRRWDIPINFNMGCIEMGYYQKGVYVAVRINFNMGCIEICIGRAGKVRSRRLTLTWDVLKYNHKSYECCK